MASLWRFFMAARLRAWKTESGPSLEATAISNSRGDTEMANQIPINTGARAWPTVSARAHARGMSRGKQRH